MRYYSTLLLLFLAAACVPKEAARPVLTVNAADPNLTTFAVIGDFGWDGPNEAAVASLVHNWHPQFVITVGDDNYEHGEAATIDANIGKHYREFIRFDQSYTGLYRGQGAEEQRFFPALGNHDWHTPDIKPYLEYFELPGNERYYQVRRGAVELFAIDSDAREPDGVDVKSKQAQWLQAALKKSTAPWKVVYMHHPPYSTGEHGSTPVMQWPFREWGASLVLAGHDHHYERIVLQGFPYWVVGTGGAPLRAPERPLIAADADVTYGKKHGALLVSADAAAITLQFFNTENALIDSYQIQAHP